MGTRLNKSGQDTLLERRRLRKATHAVLPTESTVRKGTTSHNLRLRYCAVDLRTTDAELPVLLLVLAQVPVLVLVLAPALALALTRGAG